MSGHYYNCDDMKTFVEAACTFAERIVRPVFDGVHADGVPDKITIALDRAFELGIAASPDPAQPGHEYGIWGHAMIDKGPGTSVEMLMAVAEVCGGLAMSLHVQGLASSCITLSGIALDEKVNRVACAIQEASGLPGFTVIGDPLLDEPARVQTEAVERKGGYAVTGSKSFIYSMPGTEAYAVFCIAKNEWGCFLIPAGAHGLEVSQTGARTGLRACSLDHLYFDGVKDAVRIDKGNARKLIEHAIGLNWLGIAATGAGIASGAVKAARRYASERWQGGAMIGDLPAVRMLIADAMVNRDAACALVRQMAGRFAEPDMLNSCATVRLAGLSLSASAVTDSLQVFGGYGYMEDYGMEKRLRDVAVLKSAAGSPQYLRRFIFESAGERS